MSFIETPSIDDRNVHQIDLLQDNPESLDGTLECTRVGLVKSESFTLEQLSPFVSLFQALLRQRAVNPSREAILVIPGTLTVTNQHQRVLHVQSRRTTGGGGDSATWQRHKCEAQKYSIRANQRDEASFLRT
jgi:hypothetical protein